MTTHDVMRHWTRAFRAGRFGFRVRVDDADWRLLVEGAFRDLPLVAPGNAVHEFSLTDVHRGDERMALLLGTRWSDPQPLPVGRALDHLVSFVNEQAIAVESEWIHLHAAVAALDGVGAIVVGPSGVGKSTLTLELLRQGWAYLSDETIALVPGSPMVSAFPQPITIKPAGRRLFPSLGESVAGLQSDGLSSWQVPASLVGANVLECVEPRLVVILEVDQSQPRPDNPIIKHIEAADAVVRLMEQALDAKTHGVRALAEIGNLVTRTTNVVLRGGSPTAAARALAELIADDAEREGVQLLVVNPGSAAHSDVVVSGTVCTLLIDRRVVVYDEHTNLVASFDELGSAIWLGLLGDTSTGFAIQTERDTDFIAELRLQGLLNT